MDFMFFNVKYARRNCIEVFFHHRVATAASGRLIWAERNLKYLLVYVA